MFFALDGVDGVGKSTQIALFAEWLRAAGREVVACRDPGGTPLGERVRALLLAQSTLATHLRAEMLLYMASRAQLVEEVIRPALARGAVVVSDRFLLANVVYQGHAGGLDPARVRQVGETAVAGVMPDLTFVLDMPAAAAAARLKRPLDRVESRGLDYLARVRAGFLLEAAAAPERVRVIDADRPVEAIQHDLRAAAAERLGAPA